MYDQTQARIRLESEAVTLIFERIDSGSWTHVSSEMAEREIAAMSDAERRKRVRALLPKPLSELTESIWARAAELQALGLKPADAVHVSAAEEARADVFLTCDDRLLGACRRSAKKLNVIVANPLEWLKELDDAEDAE
jgi:predicted nucleic acid-binding protein